VHCTQCTVAHTAHAQNSGFRQRVSELTGHVLLWALCHRSHQLYRMLHIKVPQCMCGSCSEPLISSNPRRPQHFMLLHLPPMAQGITGEDLPSLNEDHTTASEWFARLQGRLISLAARSLADIERLTGMPPVSMRQTYDHSTICESK